MLRTASPSALDDQDTMALETATYRERSTFWENLDHAAQMYIAEGASYSRYVNGGNFEDRNHNIDSLIADHKIDYSIVAAFENERGKLDYDGMADYLRENKDYPDIKTRKELLAESQEFINELSIEDQKTYEVASTFGKMGHFAGTVAMAASDPAYWPTYAVGLGTASRSASVLSNMIRVGTISGATEGVAETVNQFGFVKGWKEDLGRDYGIEESAKAIGVTALGGAILPAGVVGLSEVTSRTIQKGLRKRLKEATELTKGKPVDTTTKYITDDVTGLEEFFASAPSKEMPFMEHMQKMYDAEKGIKDKGPTGDLDRGTTWSKEDEAIYVKELEARGAEMAEVKALDEEMMNIEEWMACI